jgi:hypothetical protein
MDRKLFLRATFVVLFFAGFFVNPIVAQSDIFQIELGERFPAAKNVKWEQDDDEGYITAEFLDEFYQEVKVWYDWDANWVKTKTEMSFNNLPGHIKKTYQNSPYAQWKIDDIEFIQKVNEESYYILEVEKGEQEYKLIITEKGTIIQR